MAKSVSIPAQADTLVVDDTPEVLDLSVIIVNYNVREFLEQALRSVQQASANLEVEVFVVDNDSVDGSVEMVEIHFPDVHLIANKKNTGFSTANNQAIRQAQGRYLLILNPDTIVQEDTLTTMVHFMDEHPEAGALGCKILNPDGTFALESRRAFPTPRVAFFRMTGLSRLFPKSRTFGSYNLTYLPIDQEAEVDALSGSCMLVRHKALYCDVRHAACEVTAPRKTTCHGGAGLFDEGFFMYGEDLDWCYRIQQAGWKIYYTPVTKIVHYKGESTKKGELQYVRLFYGAMLRFSEKHLHDRYSRLFVWLLRGGVLARASLTLLANTLRRLALPLLDFVLVAATILVLGLLRSAQTGVDVPPLFYAMVAPGYALCTTVSIALIGGYRRNKRDRARLAWIGTLLGLLIISTLSFFAKELAFSRAVVLVSFPASAILLSLLRWQRRSRQTGPRRAVLVGHPREARRLRMMLASHPHPPFQLVGYVSDGDEAEAERQGNLPRLGTWRHLRDLVRLRRIDDVVFAADGLSNQTIFGLMQHLRDLPVQTRILAAGREHVIGKASINDLSTPALIEAEEALGTPRSYFARRSFEMTVALGGLLLYPFVGLLALVTSNGSRWQRLVAKMHRLPAVLAGHLALVGFHPEENFHPPPEWNLHPGLFAVTDTLPTIHPTPEEMSQAYWFYVRNQSAFLDWTLLWHALHTLPP